MNIQEVLNYQPTTNIQPDDDEEDESGSTKRQRLNHSVAGPSGLNNNVSSSVDIDKLIEQSESHVSELDENTLKRLVLNLERRILKNQEMRIKYADQPAKFMDSEIELFDNIKEMHVVSTQPALYQTLIMMNIISPLLGLLTHENTDIACALVALIQELTDLDDVDELDEVGALMDALLHNQITVLLVNNMERLDENVKEESEGIYNSLAIIENLTDYKPELSKDVRPLIQWILRKLKSKPIFYPNKLYASEILSILLQNSEDNRTIVGTLNGIDILLHVISYYKRHDPQTTDEEEFMKNLFNCLCSSLFMSRRNNELFYKAEGLELMVLILKEKRKRESNSDVRLGVLKLLSHCFTPSDNEDHSEDVNGSSTSFITAISNKFVDILGLRVLMPVFVKPSSILGHRHKRKQTLLDQVEEYSLSIILALLRHCHPPARQRVLNKFIENGAVKTERLVELHLKYWERLCECDEKIRNEINKRKTARKGLTPEQLKKEEQQDENEFFLQRLNEGGLFTLQLIDQIMLLISSKMEHEQHEISNNTMIINAIKERILKLLNMHSGRVVFGPSSSSSDHVQIIKNILKEFIQEKNPDDPYSKWLAKSVDLF